LVENADTDWSFGRGRAQFITGELEAAGPAKGADAKAVAELLVGYP
jgi:hypothetical protein